MRKALTGSMIVLLVFFLSAGLGLAGNGKGNGNRNGAGNGTGPIHDILNGTPFGHTGSVLECTQGQGIKIATENENVIIYGIGPVRYWDSLEDVIRPDVGDTVTVTGYVVDYNGELRNIAMDITILGGEDDDIFIPLRDPETGAPLWRGGNGKTN